MIGRLLPPHSFGRLQSRLLLVIILALGAVVGADVINLYSARMQAIRTTQSETAVLSRALAEQAHEVFQTMDTILLGLRERVETDGTTGPARRRLLAVLALRGEALPMVHRLLVTDAAGRVVVASGGSADSVAPLAASPIFRHHRTVADRGAFLGWPLRDPLDGVWTIPVSRRLDNADGSFAGMVMASVGTDLFRKAYANLDTVQQSVVLLARADGRALSRWPADPRGEAQDLSGGDLFTRVVRLGDVPSFEHASPVDGVVRYGSYRRLADLPALVVVARSKREVLAPWRQMVAAHGVALAAVLTIIALLGRRLANAITVEQEAQAVLRETHRRLAQSEAGIAQANRWLEMAEQIAQVGHWHLELGPPPVLTWSDEVYRIHGLDARRFALTLPNAIAAYHPQDRGAVRATVEGAIAAGMPFEFTARLLRTDGSIRYVLSRGLPQTDPRGATTGVFGVFMDITQQKQAEAALLEAHASAEAANQALEAANHALEDMAMRDALTGLANRRHFDRALDLEFRRAMRAGSAVALILIDVDQFKHYNDTYGHQAGDACLRAIAGVIPPLLNRPGDTANRYGGEELVVLLPGNTEAGALAMAHRIADDIRALAIVHAGSQHGVVTISAGVEAFVPVHERDTAAALVEHADLALYAAKRAGRDRVMKFDDVRKGLGPAGNAAQARAATG